MSCPSRAVRKAITHISALLLLAMTAGTAQAQVFVGADAGLSVLSQEGHAPPLCCAERETWGALGGRLGGRAGYGFGWLFVRVDAGVAANRATTKEGHKLSLVTPDAALMLGARAGGEKMTLDFAVGAGYRWFSGKATSSRPGMSNESIGTSAPDLRLSVGAHRKLNGGHSLGGELSIAKVLIAENVLTLSLVYTWGPG